MPDASYGIWEEGASQAQGAQAISVVGIKQFVLALDDTSTESYLAILAGRARLPSLAKQAMQTIAWA